MYSISYRLLVGRGTHRAISATAAVADIKLLKGGGADVVRIVVSKSGRELSLVELQMLAEDEIAPPPDRRLRRLFRILRAVKNRGKPGSR